MKFSSVTPEFRGSSAYDQQFSYVRLAAPLLDAAGINSELCGDQYSVLFHLFARGVTAVATLATHYRLCRAFLVFSASLTLSIAERCAHGIEL